MINRLQQNQLVSFQLRPPISRTPILAATLLTLLCVALEIFARISSNNGLIPFQAYGTNHVQFELQLQNLQRYIAQQGPPDCFILGNSQALRGLDPAVFNSVYREQTGQPIACYNFSVVGTNLSTTLYFSRILLEQYQPRLLIIGTNFLDFSESRENRIDTRFEDNPWIQYRLGRPSIQGWLVEHSYAYRLLLFASYGVADGLSLQSIRRELRQWTHSLSEYGYGASSETIDPAEAMKPGFIKNFLAQFGSYTTSQWNLDSLEQIVQRAQSQGSQVVVVEMPYHPSLLDLDPALPAFVGRVNQAIKNITAGKGIPYLQTATLALIPDQGWHDRYHLNSLSSPLFSRWLAEHIPNR